MGLNCLEVFFQFGCKIKGVFMTSYLLPARIGVVEILLRFGIDNFSLSGNCTYLRLIVKIFISTIKLISEVLIYLLDVLFSNYSIRIQNVS